MKKIKKNLRYIATMGKESYISEPIRREVLTEAGYRCAVPTCRTILALDLHHIVPVSEEGENEPSNLIALCPTCHRLFHKGIITRDAIKSWKGLLAVLNSTFDHETIDMLLFLTNENTKNLYLSGDGVLKFARLISAGLASFSRSYYSSIPSMKVYYWVTLTKKGKLFVDAWKKGDRLAVKEALSEMAQK